LSKVILICGKICSGKTTYAKNIAQNMNAIILSVDELMLSLFGQYLVEKYIDENIAKKFSNIFEEPKPNKIDVWYKI